ncbi:N-acetylglucosaminyl-phosphatidylinositol de-N-acetylase [Gouania willdenowi]|uniref:N-acetylglucosaminylphosphatidylinositol deacetylase n=1 Tax=Gouania willdenowi TaxID=441366 RepID=A0A8C5GN55_GOUWI|nr:N-acetylglucosaminyl-phosphatidylinositol de-N-acetylase [Gouania willdenowi]
MYLFAAVFVIFLYYIWIKYIFTRHRRTFTDSLQSLLQISRTDCGDIRALFVTAHPDDECMFFAPTFLRLAELKASVHLLCLSEGNFYNQGAERKQELAHSCEELGIPASRVTIINHKNLPDDPKAEWSISLLSTVIMKQIRTHSFNMVLTFDGKGVSGHTNHIAIYEAVRHLAASGQVPDDCCLLSLVTVGLIRKYISFLDLPLSWLLPSCLCCVIGSQGYKQAKAAMLCHRTQLLWFRYIYITLSRYMLVNTFQIIPQGPKNLKIY